MEGGWGRTPQTVRCDTVTHIISRGREPLAQGNLIREDDYEHTRIAVLWQESV